MVRSSIIGILFLIGVALSGLIIYINKSIFPKRLFRIKRHIDEECAHFKIKTIKDENHKNILFYCRCNDGSYGLDCENLFSNPCINETRFSISPDDIPNNLFIHCDSNMPNLFKCPGSLEWNQNLLTCSRRDFIYGDRFFNQIAQVTDLFKFFPSLNKRINLNNLNKNQTKLSKKDEEKIEKFFKQKFKETDLSEIFSQVRNSENQKTHEKFSKKVESLNSKFKKFINSNLSPKQRRSGGLTPPVNFPNFHNNEFDIHNSNNHLNMHPGFNHLNSFDFNNNLRTGDFSPRHSLDMNHNNIPQFGISNQNQFDSNLNMNHHLDHRKFGGNLMGDQNRFDSTITNNQLNDQKFHNNNLMSEAFSNFLNGQNTPHNKNSFGNSHNVNFGFKNQIQEHANVNSFKNQNSFQKNKNQFDDEFNGLLVTRHENKFIEEIASISNKNCQTKSVRYKGVYEVDMPTSLKKSDTAVIFKSILKKLKKKSSGGIKILLNFPEE